MSVYKDGSKWRVIYRYTDSRGERKQTQKRGFSTKKEAQAWEREQMNKTESSLDMTFESFSEIYFEDMKKRLKDNTWHTKEHILRTKLIPFFGKRKMCDIQPKDVIAWQNEMLEGSTKTGKPYSPVYLKTLHNQLSAVFNYAVKFYGLPSNPAAKAGNMGKAKNREMLFWTQEEYKQFAEVMMDKPVSFYAFEMLYWCGIREGELLALTPADFDFEKQTVSITKSYQRIKGQDIITDPKTAKSNRVVKMPDFLSQEIQDFISQLYGIGEHDRMFMITKSYLHHEMDRGAKESGVKRIRIHDLRHSHISLLIEMGFSAVAIADRVGHESIDITYRYAHLFPSTQNEMADKVTVSQEDWQNVTDLAKKEVATKKQTKKLRKERDEAVRERDELKAKLSAVSSELATYKKKEEDARYFSREKMKKEATRISREDELSRELKKAKAFISACGLSADYQQFRYNSTTRKNVLE